MRAACPNNCSDPDVGTPVTVVICTFTERRWDALVRAVASLLSQTRQPDQCVVVVDHNDDLMKHASARLPKEVEVIANKGTRGIAGARNSGVYHARGEIIAFMDDDAEADPEWLQVMITHFQDQRVVGVGGSAKAVWPQGDRPRWFPCEFDWVVGCSYRGLPEDIAPIRNPIGASMALRRSLFEEVGGFDPSVGRLGRMPSGCEETEFALRVRERMSGVDFLFVPKAIVHHNIERERVRFHYFLRRCYAEGVSKAAVARRMGAVPAVSAERRYVVSTLRQALAAEIINVSKGDGMSLVRLAMIILGLSATTAGFLAGQATGILPAARLEGPHWSIRSLASCRPRWPVRQRHRDDEPLLTRRIRSSVKLVARSVVPSPHDLRRIVLIFGCQRSGTTMLQQTILDRSWRVYILEEHDGRLVGEGREENEWKDESVALGRIRSLPFEVVAVKPLVESYRARSLLKIAGTAHGIWMLRHYVEVAQSNLKRFGLSNAHKDLEPFLTDDSEDWRCRGASQETRDTVNELMRDGLEPLDAAALFWWTRNQLYFDQNLASNDQIRVLRYERVCDDPEEVIRSLSSYIGLSLPEQSTARRIQRRQVDRRFVVLHPRVEALCSELWKSFAGCREL